MPPPAEIFLKKEEGESDICEMVVVIQSKARKAKNLKLPAMPSSLLDPSTENVSSTEHASQPEGLSELIAI